MPDRRQCNRPGPADGRAATDGPSDEWLTIAELVAKHRGRISASSIRRCIRKGTVEFDQPAGPRGKIYVRGDTLFGHGIIPSRNPHAERRPDEWLTIREVVAEYRGRVSVSSIRRYIQKGLIEVDQPGGPKGKIYVRNSPLFRRQARRLANNASSPQHRPGVPAAGHKTTVPRWMRGH